MPRPHQGRFRSRRKSRLLRPSDRFPQRDRSLVSSNRMRNRLRRNRTRASSLLLAGVLNQHLVSLGIAVVLLGIGAFQSAGLLRSRMARPNHRETGLLADGALIGLAAAILREGPVILATALAVGAALPF